MAKNYVRERLRSFMANNLYENYERFIEARLTIVDKKQAEVPFVLNPIQKKFVRDATGKDIILKARQQGFSSFVLAAFTADFLLKENSLSVVVADITENANDLLARVKWYLKSYEHKTGAKVPLKYNSKRELHNGANNARYIIGTAENIDFGRSKTITNLHLSEPAFYPHFRALLASVSSAVVPDGKQVIETTANGFGEFKTFWDESTLDLTGYKPHFYPAQDFYDEAFLEERKKALGRLYRQEFPATALEAFITSGESYFSQEAMEDYLRNVQEPINV
jgi:hypothetical protein